MKDAKELLVRCACTCRVLHILKYHEDYGTEVYINVYKQHNDIVGWKNKLRWIWSILKGKVFDDEFILKNEDLARFKEFVKNL